MDGQETVGYRLGRASLGGSETEAWTSWTDGKPWEIAFGELGWERARRKRGYPLDGRDGSAGIVDGQGTPVGICLARARLGGARWKRGHRGRTGNRGKYGESLGGSENIVDRQETVGNGFGRNPLEARWKCGQHGRTGNRGK